MVALASPLRVSVIALVCCLSCSIWTAPEPPPRPGPHALVPVEMSGPSAVEFVEARFHAHHAGLAPDEIRAVSEAVVREAMSHDMPWDLVLAVIKTESGFHNFAVSQVGALGLMQIMPATGEILADRLDERWDGEETLFRPVVNVKFGTSYLAFLHDRYRDWDKALAAYNWGPARIDWRLRHRRALPVEYAQKVKSYFQSPVTP